MARRSQPTDVAAALVAARSGRARGVRRCALLGRASGEPPAILQVDGTLAVQADRLDIDILAGEATLTGNVTLTKGDLKSTCPRIDLKFDNAPHVTWAKGSGGVTADVRGVHAEAPEAELDLTKQVLDLRGGVRLARGQGWLRPTGAHRHRDGEGLATQVKGSIPVRHAVHEPRVARARLAARGSTSSAGERRSFAGSTSRRAPGEVLGVLGPSGAGKSTLFRALVGELPGGASGRVFLGDAMSPLAALAAGAGRVGYVPQRPSVLWDLTVRGNLVAFHRIVHGNAGDPVAGAQRVGLGERLDVPPGELSAGERRRLELARALVRPPRVLVCDEPFAGVDPVGAAQLARLLEDLAGEGRPSSSRTTTSPRHCALATRAMLLLDGAVAASGDPDASATIRSFAGATWALARTGRPPARRRPLGRPGRPEASGKHEVGLSPGRTALSAGTIVAVELSASRAYARGSSCKGPPRSSAMEIKQQLKLSQQLVMTPQLQQAIRLLQLSRLELIDEIRKELDANPVLADEEIDPRARANGDGKNGEVDQSSRRGARLARRWPRRRPSVSDLEQADRGQAGPGDRLGAVPREPHPPAAPPEQPRRLRGAAAHRAEPHQAARRSSTTCAGSSR